MHLRGWGQGPADNRRMSLIILRRALSALRRHPVVFRGRPGGPVAPPAPTFAVAAAGRAFRSMALVLLTIACGLGAAHWAPEARAQAPSRAASAPAAPASKPAGAEPAPTLPSVDELRRQL